MIKPDKKQDWFIVERNLIETIFGVPGIEIASEIPLRFRLHRSHLALLDDVRVQRAIEFGATKVYSWDERDRKTEPLGFKLRTTQHQAVDYIQARRGTLLGDDMRVGKTLSALYSHDPSMGKLVVVAPLNTRMVWLSWMARLWPDLPIGVMIGRTFDPEAARLPLVFGHYDVIAAWQSGDRIGTLILDEAHWLVNHRSRRAMAATFLASRADRVIAATGTPIWNMPPGLWSVLGLVAPGAWGSYYDFCNRYGAPMPTAYGTKYTGISNGEELSQRLTQVMLRRRWVDVQSDLPPITRNITIVDIDQKKQRQLDIEAESLRDSGKTNTAANLARYRDALSLVKLPATVQEAVTCMQAGEPIVIWAWHRQLAERIEKRLIEDNHQVFLITGEVAPHRREKILEEWKGSSNAALVISMAVGQVGIDLSHARRAIFAEIDYTPAMVAQAEMRTFSPERSMNITYIVADHFVDRKIVLALTRKLEAATPLDLGMGEGVISAIDRAFKGPEETADMQRFMNDLLAS